MHCMNVINHSMPPLEALTQGKSLGPLLAQTLTKNPMWRLDFERHLETMKWNTRTLMSCVILPNYQVG